MIARKIRNLWSTEDYEWLQLEFQHINEFGSVTLLDDDFRVDLRDEKEPDEQGVIVATRPLTDENWVGFKPGQLTVVENGEIIFS